MRSPNQPLPAQRQNSIIDLLQKQRSVRVDELMRLLGVSENTIRRDLHELESQGHLRRTSGGAVIPAPPYASSAFDARVSNNRRWKQGIALRAMEEVSAGQTLILDSGTTTLEMARLLRAGPHLTVATNSIEAAHELLAAPEVSVLVCGGQIHPPSRALVGKAAEEFFTGIRADLLFLSVRALSLRHGLLGHSALETPVKQAMIKSAGRVIVLADHTKLEQGGLSFIAPLSALEAVITDTDTPPGLVAAYREAGVKLILAG